MGLLGIRSLSIALSVGLVVSTALIVGLMSYTTGDTAVGDTKSTGERGLAEAFSSGQRDVEDVAGRLLSRTVDVIAAQMEGYMRTPSLIVRELLEFLTSFHPDDVADPHWIKAVLQPQIRALTRMSYNLGVSMVSAIVMPLSPRAMNEGIAAGTYMPDVNKWGGAVMGLVYDGPDHPMATPDGKFICAIESRVMVPGGNGTMTLGTNDSHVWFGDMDKDGSVIQRPETHSQCGQAKDKMNGLAAGRLNVGDPTPECVFNTAITVPENAVVVTKTIKGGLEGTPELLETPNVPHWSGFMTAATRMSADCYGVWTHPQQLALMPNTPDPRSGYVKASVDTAGIAEIMKKVVADVGYVGMRFYGVQRHPWTQPPYYGKVEMLVGATAGMDFTVEETLPEENDGMTWRAIPRPAVDSDNPTISMHATHVFTLPANYSSLVTNQVETWTFSGRSRELSFWTDVQQRGLSQGQWERGIGGQYKQLSAKEEEVMKDKVAREVAYWTDGAEDVLYWTRVQSISDQYGYLWYLVLLVPKDVMLSQIDAARVQVKADIDKDYKATDDKVSKMYLVMWIIVVVVSLVLLVFSVILASVITQPLFTLEKEMRAVALMQLDSVDADSKTLSRLSEVRKMQRSFHRMIKNLREFRNFMPASILQDANEVEEEEEEEVLAPSVASKSQASKASKASKATKSQSQSRSQARRTEASSRQSGSQSASHSQAMRAFLQKTMGDGLKKKRVTLASTNVVGWHALTEGKAEAKIIQLHTDLIQGIIDRGIEAKGVPDSFSGDRVLFSFNAVRQLATHRPAAGDALSKIGEFFASFDGPEGKLRASAALGSGEAKVGNMGCAGMRRFTFLTPYLGFGQGLERVSRLLGTAALVDGQVKEDLEGNFYFRIVDLVLYPKRGKKAVPIWEMLNRKEASEDEWMYQLEEGAAKDPSSAWNAAAEALVLAAAKDTPADPALVDTLGGAAFDALPPAVLARFRDAAQAGRLEPRELLYN